LGERLLCKQEVTGSIPVSSTRSQGFAEIEQRVSDCERKAACCGALELKKHLPNAGRQTDTVIILFTVTRNVVLAPIIGQVRRAAIVQRHLKLSKSCKVKTGSRRSAHSRLGGAGLATNRRTRYLTTE
jgi:hypothetical protein